MRKIGKRKMNKNKKGQTMIVGLMLLVMATIMFIAMVPAMASIFSKAEGCDSLNCGGYVDADATSGSTCSSTNRSYQVALAGNTNDLACTVIGLGIPYIVLAVIVALVTKLIHGKLVDEPTPDYGAYSSYPGY